MELLLFVLGFLLVLAACIGAGIWQDMQARTTRSLLVDVDPSLALRAVQDQLGGYFWDRTGGPGTVNARRRTLFGGGWVLSADVSVTPEGRTQINAWLSTYETYFGLAYKVDPKAAEKLLRKVDNALSGATAQQMPGPAPA